MHRAVVTNDDTQRSGQANHGRQSQASPSTVVLKDEQSLMCRCTWSQDPQRDDDGEQTAEVQEEDDAFDERKLGCEDRIKGN